MRLGLDRIIDRGVDVIADQLHRDIATALEGDVDHLLAGRLFHDHGDDLVFLLRAGTAHLQGVGRLRLERLEKGLGCLVGRLFIDPQHKLVEGQHGHRREVTPVEGHAGGKWRRKQIRQGDHDLVRIAGCALDGQKAFGTGATRLVDHDDRLLGEVVLGHHTLDEARHLVGAATGASGHNKLDRLGRLPGLGVGGSARQSSERKGCGGGQMSEGRSVHGVS